MTSDTGATCQIISTPPLPKFIGGRHVVGVRYVASKLVFGGDKVCPIVSILIGVIKKVCRVHPVRVKALAEGRRTQTVLWCEPRVPCVFV